MFLYDTMKSDAGWGDMITIQPAACQRAASANDRRSLSVTEIMKQATGQKGARVMAATLSMQGWQLLPIASPEIYRMGATLYPTLRRGAVRIALAYHTQLSESRGEVYHYHGCGIDTTLLAVITDDDARRQGLAREAVRSVALAADAAQCELWVEAVPMARKIGAPASALRKLYLAHGWEPISDTHHLMKRTPRKPGALS